MEYKIEVDEAVNDVLKSNAIYRGVSVPTLIAQIVERYTIDAHIMEQTQLWQNGIKECAEIELDWANL